MRLLLKMKEKFKFSMRIFAAYIKVLFSQNKHIEIPLDYKKWLQHVMEKLIE